MADRHNQAWILELKIQVMPAIFVPSSSNCPLSTKGQGTGKHIDFVYPSQYKLKCFMSIWYKAI